ncbi:helix-turn-helix transcriptional regulator [Streptococcus parauberis]|uniref:helix-turn-helix domain-containing protein n=1 Tax=Streptococcus parauberis TaxID=1348 RepID=UPI002892415C|nr:helix-turn-helix transcriptional regulator [Streptococcus parauberis]MDT2748362.1 helix-turn-helix transcriptional regulator [Streptococcus parauberis]
MTKESMGMIIASKRKEKAMTQLELSSLLGVTDKAVSKWERDLSLPDTNTIPKLAEILDIRLEDLMQTSVKIENLKSKTDTQTTIRLVLRAIPLAMGVAVIVLSILGKLEMKEAITLLAVGVTSLAIYLLNDH